MLAAVAILGWLAALVLAILRWRHVCRPRVYQPVTTTGTYPLPEAGLHAALYQADGTLESVRRLKGAPPPTIHRPHGRGPATVYRLCGLDGTRARYEAE